MPTEKITTNHRFYEPLTSYGLSKRDVENFGYMDEDTLENSYFVRAQGYVYALSEFQRLDKPIIYHGIEFCGYHNPSVWEAVLIAINDEGQVCVGYSRTM